MGQRLRPFDSSWMAPYSLAAQLTARAGESIGQGLASIGQGIAGGIQTRMVRQEREASRAEDARRFDLTRADNAAARAEMAAERKIDNERMDKSMRIGVLKDQFSWLNDNRESIKKQAEDLAAVLTTQDTPELREALKKLGEKGAATEASMRSIGAEILKSGGINVDPSTLVYSPMPEAPSMSGAAPSAGGPMVNEGGVMGGGGPAPSALKTSGYSDMSQEDLVANLGQIDKRMESITKKMGNTQNPSALAALGRTLETLNASKLLIMHNLKKQEAAVGDAEKDADEARKAAGMSRDAAKLGYTGPPLETAKGAEAALALNKQNDAQQARADENAKKAEATAAIRKEILDLRKRDMALKEAKFELEKQGDGASASKISMQRKQVLSAIVSAADNTMRNLSFPIESETEDQKSERLKMFESAKRELIQATIDLREVEKEILNPPAPAVPVPGAPAAPAATGGAPAGETSAERLKRLWGR